MGKKKDKKRYDKMSLPEQYAFLRDQADNYSINMDGFSPSGDVSGRFGTPTGSYKDLEEVIAKREYDNFSNRMALQEAALAGNKKAARMLDMNEGINRTAAVERWMEKQHDKHVGGGAYTWGSDPAAVAQHFAEKNRNALLAGADSESVSDSQDEPSDSSASMGYELSPELNAAIDRNREFEEARYAGEIFADAFNEAEGEGEGFSRDNPFLFSFADRMRLG